MNRIFVYTHTHKHTYIYTSIQDICVSAYGEGNGHPLQYSCLENVMNRGAWWAAVHRVAQSRTRLKRLSMHAYIYIYIYTHMPMV